MREIRFVLSLVAIGFLTLWITLRVALLLLLFARRNELTHGSF